MSDDGYSCDTCEACVSALRAEGAAAERARIVALLEAKVDPADQVPARRDMSALEDALDESNLYWQRVRNEGGPDMLTNAHLKLCQEGHEFTDNPSLEEAADVLIVLALACAQNRWSFNSLAAHVRAKDRINRQRTWELQEDGTYQHVRA